MLTAEGNLLPDSGDYPPLVYFYGGAPVPEYANLTLRRMRSRWRGEIVVLHSEKVPKEVRGINYSLYTEWYDPEPFEDFRRGSPLDESFRQGFWYLTAERFFVLAQWAERTGSGRFLHAELDVALYDVADLPNLLDTWGVGLFYPRASAEFAGASLLYVNRLQYLSDFLTFARQNSHFGYEMRVLAAFNDSHPEKSFALPAHSSIGGDLGSDGNWERIEAADIGGIIDVGALGTWMLGDDPKNVRGRPTYNKAVIDGHGSPALASIRFRYSLFRGLHVVTAPNSSKIRIKALSGWYTFQI